MSLLLASLVALGVGPLLYRLARSRRSGLSFLDGFVLVVIVGLVVWILIPSAVARGGLWTLAFCVVGVLGPAILERVFHRSVERTHLATLLLVLAGLGLHALLDGTALVAGTGAHATHRDSVLPMAVILHRVPVGLTIWWLVRPAYGVRAALAVLGLLAATTTLGFFAGPQWTSGLPAAELAWLEALVAGSLLHVVFHRHPTEDAAGGGTHRPRFEGAGALLGIVLLVLLPVEGPLEDSVLAQRIAGTFVDLALESAPALVLAYLMAGVVSAFLPQSSIAWMSRGTAWSQALRGMAVGLPVPVCSCGVVPVYRAFVGRGVPATAAMAFLVATPELGLDAVFLSVPLLGWKMTLMRVGGAALLALLVGWVVGRWVRRVPRVAGCEARVEARSEPAFAERLRTTVRVGLGDVVNQTAPWILLGLAVAAVVEPVLGSGVLRSLPPGLEVVLFALLGFPTYVCASGATPLVAVLLATGVSPGAALAFLLTGPATNLTTFGVLSRMHGRGIALGFSAFMAGTAVALGYLVNALVTPASVAPPPLDPSGASSLQWAALVALTLIYAASLFRLGARRFLQELVPDFPLPHADHHHA